ncbi:MAG: LON peptidase substrate-binding domain-containing protein [Pseudomonadota bacterium]|nr:LON peptidase substrate-binding domain-containing protein [Pseudomonadota bacterium]
MPSNASELHHLPLLPLGTVLFPGGVLPLRIFEVRYFDMIGKCHQTHAPFGVVALRQGNEVRVPGAPEEQLHTHGTLARIRHLRQAQPGLIHIECTGTQRFHIQRHTRLKHGLWVADVALLPDDPPIAIPPDLAHTASTLRHVLDKLRQHSGTSLPDTASEHFDDCAWVSNRWCELLPLALPQKQHLMTLDSPLVRLELVADLLGAA